MMPDGTGVFFVDFAGSSKTGPFTCEKSAREIYNAVNSGCNVVGRLMLDGHVLIPHLEHSSGELAQFLLNVMVDDNPAQVLIQVTNYITTSMAFTVPFTPIS